MPRARSCFLLVLMVLLGASMSACGGRASLDNGYFVGDGGSGAGDSGPPAPRPSPPCDVTSCPHGCCDADGQCRRGDEATACGYPSRPGEACTDCTALGYLECYQGTQLCAIKATSCGPGNCAGCCIANGQSPDIGFCLPGNDKVFCGSGGVLCDACGLWLCGPASCPGCCVGNECVLGSADDACGRKGADCAACGVGQTCSADPGGAGGSCE